jgi:hypothetical protein
MNYESITLSDIIETYQYAERPDDFIGFICDADKQTVTTEFELVN